MTCSYIIKYIYILWLSLLLLTLKSIFSDVTAKLGLYLGHCHAFSAHKSEVCFATFEPGLLLCLAVANKEAELVCSLPHRTLQLLKLACPVTRGLQPSHRPPLPSLDQQPCQPPRGLQVHEGAQPRSAGSAPYQHKFPTDHEKFKNSCF
jgi:hypothetical protein